MPDIAVPFFCSLPSSPPPWPGVVVVMEGDGMKPQLLRVCERLATEGYAVGAPDLYWRFGGSNPEAGGNPYGQLRHSDGLADIIAVADRLRSLGATKLGITGFCMGGGYAYLAATRDVGFAASVPFYGGGIAEHLGEPTCPLLCFFGGNDEWIPRDNIAKVEAAHPGRVVVYEDAQHGFMRDESPTYHDTAAPDAWRRLLTFFAEHLRAACAAPPSISFLVLRPLAPGPQVPRAYWRCTRERKEVSQMSPTRKAVAVLSISGALIAGSAAGAYAATSSPTTSPPSSTHSGSGSAGTPGSTGSSSTAPANCPHM